LMVASFPSAMRAYTVVRPNPTTRQNSFTRYANGWFGRTVSRAASLVAVMVLSRFVVRPVPPGARIIRACGASEFHRKAHRLQLPPIWTTHARNAKNARERTAAGVQIFNLDLGTGRKTFGLTTGYPPMRRTPRLRLRASLGRRRHAARLSPSSLSDLVGREQFVEDGRPLGGVESGN